MYIFSNCKSYKNCKYLMAAGQLLVQFPAPRGSGRPAGVSTTRQVAVGDTSGRKSLKWSLIGAIDQGSGFLPSEMCQSI